MSPGHLFLWKTAAARSNITRFVATIAYQMDRAIPAALKPLWVLTQ